MQRHVNAMNFYFYAMKILVLVFSFSLSNALFSQQTVGEIYERMSTLPWMNDTNVYLTNTGLNSSQNFFFDSDKDGSKNIQFSLFSNASAALSSYSVTLMTSDGFKIHKDTTYVEYFQFVNNLAQTVDSTRKTEIVKKYHEYDTLFSDQVVKSTIGKISNYYQKNFPLVLFNNVLPFVNDTSYIVLEKGYYLTILKVWMPNSGSIQIIEARTNEPLAFFRPVFCYPNPSSTTVRFVGNIEKIQAFDLDGTKVYENLDAPSNPEVNLENLNQGVYIFSCFMDNTCNQIKVVKTDQ